MSEINVTDETFQQEVLESKLPVLVDFWNERCFPCMTLAPTLSQIADEQKGKWKVVKINVGLYPELATRYQIYGVPTLAVFKHGELIQTRQGSFPKMIVERMLK
ncbi:MAG: thioredoxin [Erysipelotrichaceae bacterium]|nr:thioredoxin [Erysipelotrichaceae bacterium]